MERRFALSSPAGKSLVPLSREDARLDPFLGCTIRKIFGSQWYYGQVIAIDVDVASGERAYHIVYEDGDEEHLSTNEVRNFLVMASRSAPPSEPGSPRRSTVPSHRPSIARTEAPRPSISPSISQPPAAAMAASFSRGFNGRSPSGPNLSFWGSMVLAGLTGAMMVALVSSLLSFMTSSGEMADGLGDRVQLPAGLVAPLPAWAEAEAPLSNLAKVGGGHAPVAAEDLIPSPVMEEVEKERSELAVDAPSQPEGYVQEQFETFQGSRVGLEDGQPSPPTSYLEAEDLREEPSEINLKADQDDREPLMRGDEHLGGQLVDSSAEEDLSVAVAAVVEASGLVVRVVAKSFFRTLEKVWHWILSSFSSGLDGLSFGGGDAVEPEPPAPPPPPPLPEPEEAAGALQSLMTTILVACAGVIMILVNIHPPPSIAQELQDAVNIHEAKAVLLPYQAPSPGPSPAAPFPSPAPLQQMQKQQVRQILESVSTPARGKSLGGRPEVAASPLNSAKYWSQKPVADGRTLMTMMGRTPQAGTTLPVANFSDRRPPPPPKSLTIGNENAAPPRTQEACARCNSAMPADANFCRYCGHQRNKKVVMQQAKATTPPPKQTTAVRRESSREPRVEAYSRPKSSLIVDKPRFRYGNGLKKLKEMGYEDTQEIRDILTKCSGDLSSTLRMINGSSPRMRA